MKTYLLLWTVLIIGSTAIITWSFVDMFKTREKDLKIEILNDLKRITKHKDLKTKTANDILKAKKKMNWPVLLSALIAVEKPKTAQSAKKAIEREGAYGPLQIRQPVLDDVNSQYNLNLTLSDCLNETVARWVCVHYLKMWGADNDYETAAPVWNGGPDGMYEDCTKKHWLKVKKELNKLGWREK